MQSINYIYGQISNRPVFYTKSQIQPVEEYLRWKESYSKSAHKSYRIWVERFHKFVGKNPEDLVLEDITNFSATIRERYASNNVQYGMSIVHNYLRFFHEQGRLSLPLYMVKIPKGISRSHYAITEGDYKKMLAVLNKRVPMPLQAICIIRLLHDTGMRVGELRSLTLDDIKGNRTAIIKTEKTMKMRRIFWGENTDALLKRYLNLRCELILKNDSNALFIGSKGKYTGRITNRSIERMTRSVALAAGIQDAVCPHSFRHGFIHRLAKKRVTDAVISQMVGHSTPHTVAEYTKLSRVELEETFLAILKGN